MSFVISSLLSSNATTAIVFHKNALSRSPGPCFDEGVDSGPNSSNTCEPFAAEGADTAE